MQCIEPVGDELEVESTAKGQRKHYHPGLLQRYNFILILLKILPLPLHLTQINFHNIPLYLDVDVGRLFGSVFVPVQPQSHANSPLHCVLWIILTKIAIIVIIVGFTELGNGRPSACRPRWIVGW